MVFNTGKYLVEMRLMEPSVRLMLFNKHKHMIKRACCFRDYSTKEKVKRQRKPKGEVVQPPPEVACKDVKAEYEPTCNDKIIEEIIVKSKEEKNSKANAVPSPETGKKYPVMSKYLIQNMMDFPLHKPNDFNEDNISELTPEFLGSLPSISAILNRTQPVRERALLENWKKKMIAELGRKEFYDQRTDPVKKVRSKKVLPKNVKKSNEILSGKLSRGYKFHSYLKKRLLGEDYKEDEVTECTKACWDSVSNVLSEVSDVRLVESNIYHPVLYYKGVVDCVALYRNEWHVIEWKVGDKIRKSFESTYSAPLQACAYMGSLSWRKEMDFPEPVTKGLIVYAFPDGSPSQIFPMDEDNSAIFWERWLMRLKEFWAAHSGMTEARDGDEERDADSDN